MFLFGNIISCVLYHKFAQKESFIIWYSWDIVVVVVVVIVVVIVVVVITAVKDVFIVDFVFSCIFVLDKFDFKINSSGKITI